MARFSQLRRILEQEVPPFPNPKRDFEQYRTPPEIALVMASLVPSTCRLVIDLGTGTGMIAFAVSLSRGLYVAALDMDVDALVAAKNSSLYRTGLIDLVAADARSPPIRKGVAGLCVVQNPPFGVVRRGADRAFVEAAASTGAQAVVSLHLFASKARRFLERLYGGNGFRLEYFDTVKFPIPQLYSHHFKRIHYAGVVVVLARRVEVGEGAAAAAATRAAGQEGIPGRPPMHHRRIHTGRGSICRRRGHSKGG